MKADAEDGEIITRIFLSDDENELTPPLGSGKSITKEQKETLQKWIEQGAEYRGYSEFISPKRSSVPEIHLKHSLVDACSISFLMVPQKISSINKFLTLTFNAYNIS